jgi:hypothetical protein
MAPSSSSGRSSTNGGRSGVVCTIAAVAVEDNRPRAGPMIPAPTLDLGNCNFALRHPSGWGSVRTL